MANLIQRITGGLTAEENNQKIGLHAFTAAIHEQQSGYMTVQEVVDAFSLDTAQKNQTASLVALMNAAPEEVLFMRVFKDLMYLGESGSNTAYQDMTTVITRLENEVTDQGGILP